MKWFFPTLSLLLIAALLGISHASLASLASVDTTLNPYLATCVASDRSLASLEGSQERSPQSKKVTCSYHGKFKHSSNSAHIARQATTTACFEAEISRGSTLPDDEQSDYIIESCLNETVCS